jgi:hypothetical protein
MSALDSNYQGYVKWNGAVNAVVMCSPPSEADQSWHNLRSVPVRLMLRGGWSNMATAKKSSSSSSRPGTRRATASGGRSKTAAKKKSSRSSSSSSKGRKYSSKAQTKVGKVMREYKQGKLKSGGKRKVKSRKQAIAIGISEARKSGAKVPRKKAA